MICHNLFKEMIRRHLIYNPKKYGHYEKLSAFPVSYNNITLL